MNSGEGGAVQGGGLQGDGIDHWKYSTRLLSREICVLSEKMPQFR